ncbi:MAG: hypothetical protein ACRDY2_01275 [Acidimicrobiales bacterium]
MSAAYVVSQVVSAMNAPNDSVVETISQNTPTDPAIPAIGGKDWQYPMRPKPGQQVQVASTTTSRSGQTLSAFFGTFVQPGKVQGHPAKGSCRGATGVATHVNYTARTFFRQPNWCSPPFDNGPSSPVVLPSTDTQPFTTCIIGELAQGFWSIVGHPKVDGEPTIELAPKRLTVLDAQSGLSLKVRLWVSPTTYFR